MECVQIVCPVRCRVLEFEAFLKFFLVVRRSGSFSPCFRLHLLPISRLLGKTSCFRVIRSLKKCGVKAVIFDKDNTLTPPYSFVMNKNIDSTVRECQKLFGYDKVVIFSNSAGRNLNFKSHAGSDDDKGYLHAEAIEEELGIRVIRHKQKKPDGLLETVSLWADVSAHEVMMVGDRYLTDIYGGNLYGMLTVCVGIFTEENDNKGAILVYFVCLGVMRRVGELSEFY